MQSRWEALTRREQAAIKLYSARKKLRRKLGSKERNLKEVVDCFETVFTLLDIPLPEERI